MTRVRPTDRRAADSFELMHGGQSYTVTLGQQDAAGDGPTIEVFVNARKLSSSVEAIARDAAILISFALQYGAPPDELRRAVTRDDIGEPASVVGAILDAMSAP
jgi:hypothetical protein